MLFDSFVARGLSLRNRIVMAPMTRNRALGNVPNQLMADYYAQRASIGLIVTEGVAPSPNGLGYARIPGLFSDEQVKGWRLTTKAVHDKGGRIFAQLMHTGRASHADNLPAGARVVSSVATPLSQPIFTDGKGPQPATVPHPLTEAEIAETVAEYANAAKRAIEAGFDGIELHGANGYLIEQFLNANVNTRADGYGGSIAARNRFAVEVSRACAEAIGPERVGIRISPYGAFNDTGAFSDVEPQYVALMSELSALGLLYVHLVDHSAMGAPAIPPSFKAALRSGFKGLFIASGGLDRAKAEEILSNGEADLVAFGRPALANPDLVERLREHAALNPPDFTTFYTADAKGYTDYPALTPATA